MAPVVESQRYYHALKVARELVEGLAGPAQQAARAAYCALEASWDWTLGRREEARTSASLARRMLDRLLSGEDDG